MSEIRTLVDLKKGEAGIVESFNDDLLSLKLCEMGCVPGCEVVLSCKAPFNGPICIHVSGYSLSLRREEASKVRLQ